MNKTDDLAEETKDLKEADGPLNAPEEQTSNLPVKLQDYLKDKVNVGFEDLDPDDFPTPTLILIQKNSETTDAEGNAIAPGQFYYKGTKEVFREVECALLSVTKKDLPDWSNKDELVKTYIVMGALEPDYKPFLLYLKRTAIGPFKKFLGEVRATYLPMFVLKVRLTSERKEGDKGTYYLIKFNIMAPRTESDEVMMLEGLTQKYGPKLRKEADDSDGVIREPVGEGDIPF